MAEPVLQLSAISRAFGSGDEKTRVLDDLDLVMGAGERIAIMGSSGSGKSTLLHVAAGMDRPDAGRVRIAGTDLAGLDEPELTRHRARHIGLVFQDFNLMDSLTVSENIELPLWLNGIARREHAVSRLAEELGIGGLLDRLPESLSGGEKQRVAIARALVHRPLLVLADEPTGALDEVTAASVMTLFEEVTRQSGASLLLVTHDRDVAAVCQRTLTLSGGQLH